jgi:branched-chain amino acid transport system ATP-binding protein
MARTSTKVCAIPCATMFCLALRRRWHACGGRLALYGSKPRAFHPQDFLCEQVLLDGVRISGRPSSAVFAAGLARTFQIPRPFPEMSVLDNVMLAPRGQLGERFWTNWLRPRAVAQQERAVQAAARHWLDFVGLSALAAEPARVLSGGQRKLLELARVMVAEPKLVLLDEPGAGVNPALLDQIVDRVAELNRQGVTFLVIEHNMDLVATLCNPVMVMAQGRMLAQGPADAVLRDERVVQAYLGDGA